MSLPDLEAMTSMDGRLRQVPRDRSEFAEAVGKWNDEPEKARSTADSDRIRRALTNTGSGYRILREFNFAARNLSEARELAEASGEWCSTNCG